MLRRSSHLLALAALPAAAAAPSEEDSSWLSFPSRHGTVKIHSDCVHHLDSHVQIESGKDGGDVLLQDAGRQELPPCPHAPLWESSAPTSSALQDASPNYYSDWVAYAVSSHKQGFGYMATDWEVPPAPKSTGPVPGMSSVYFFNGLEDGGGVHGASSYILQPVLSYGKSGCIINPANFFQWHLTSFSVTGAGRAYCGARLKVSEGEKVRGIMRLEKDGLTWTTESIRLSTNETSTQSTVLKEDNQPDAAYVTLETMINYNCKLLPSSGSIKFHENVLADRAGASITPSWTQMLRHTECQQKVNFDTDGSVTMSWAAADASELAQGAAVQV